MDRKFSELLAEMRNRETETTLEKFAEMMDADMESIDKRLTELENRSISQFTKHIFRYDTNE